MVKDMPSIFSMQNSSDLAGVSEMVVDLPCTLAKSSILLKQITYTSITWHNVVDVDIVEPVIADENLKNLCNSCQETIDEQCTVDDMQSIIKAMPQSNLHAILGVMWESEDEYKADGPSDNQMT